MSVHVSFVQHYEKVPFFTRESLIILIQLDIMKITVTYGNAFLLLTLPESGLCREYESCQS